MPGSMRLARIPPRRWCTYGESAIRGMRVVSAARWPERRAAACWASLRRRSAAGIAGLAVGIPSLRLRGDYLAIVTLGFGEIIRVLILNIDAIGGARGFSGIPQLSNFFLGLICLS